MTTKRLEIVQVMRAFACVSIFLYHLPVAWGGVKSNYSGFSLVVFFIFTGYFLMEGTRKSEKFYFRKKVIRLVPLYWLLTIALFLISLVMPGINGGKSYSWSNLIYSLLFIPYYSADGKLFPILSVGWTLILEMYEYIVFWVLYKVLKKNKQRELLTVVLFAGLVLLGNVLNLYCADMPILVIWSYKYQWAFLIGVLISIYKNTEKYKKITPADLNSNVVLIAYAVLFALCTYAVGDSFALVLGTIAAGIGLIIFPALNFPKWIVGFGNLSFSFYLIHKFVIAVVSKIVNHVVHGALTGVTGMLLAFILTLIASIISYRLIEKKMTDKLKKVMCK